MKNEKIFDTSTIDGIKKAERYQQKAYNNYNTVKVIPYGINKIKIICA